MNQIRPLIAFKKENPGVYAIIMQMVDRSACSIKQQENNFYYWYCFFESGIYKNHEGETIEEKINASDCRFFWKDPNTSNNKCTITEMGRLLLTGWYYGIKDFAQAICQQLFNAWKFKQDSSLSFNDLEFAEALKHIRENIGYYYHHTEQLKIYMLEHFFMEQIKPLLPEMPEKLKRFYEVTKLFEDIKQHNLKKKPDYYYERCEELEEYISYLEEILDENGLSYLSLEEYTKQQTEEGAHYVQEIEEAEQAYRARCSAALLEGAAKLKMLT